MPTPPQQFEPTRWSLILQARGSNDAQRERALQMLCTAYWYPLYAFLRRSGRGIEDAQDLVQEFFAQLLDGRLLAVAAPANGRFRTLLLRSLKNLNADFYRAETAQRRGGGIEFVQIDTVLAEDRWQLDASRVSSPELSFDRAWAAAMLDRATTRLRDEHAASGKMALFTQLFPRITTGSEDGLAAAAGRLGMKEAAVKTALSRLRKRYADALRDEIAETVGSREDITDELRYLLANFT